MKSRSPEGMAVSIQKWGVAAIATLSLLLSSLTGIPSAHAIEGGQEMSGQVPWVVSLTLQDAKGQDVAECTGTLISPTFVLTAGHCLRPPATQALVFVSPKLSETKRSFRSKRVVRSDANDVALVELAEATPRQTYPKLSTMHEDSAAIMYGFGLTASDGKPESESTWPNVKSAVQSLTGEVSNLSIAPSWEGLTNGFYKGLFLNREIIGTSDDGHALPGDSGGPLVQFGAITGVSSLIGLASTLRYKLGLSSRAGTTLFASLTPVHNWILAQTNLTDADISADYPTRTIKSVDILGNGRWLESRKQPYGTVTATFTESGANLPTFDLLFDTTGAFQIRDANGKCLTLNSRPFVTDAGLSAFGNQTTFGPCDYLDPKQKFALRNPEGDGSVRTKYTIANSTSKLSLIASHTDVQASTSSADSMIIQSESGENAAALAAYAAQRASGPGRAKRDTSAAASRIILQVPGKGSLDLPSLPSGVHPSTIQTATQNGQSSAYVLGDDGRVYVTASSGPANSTFTPWAQRPQSGITQIAAATSGTGAVYTDGASIYTTATGKLPALPAPTNVGQIAMTAGGGRTFVYALGSNGVLYRLVDGGAWTTINWSVGTIAASETDAAIAYIVNGQVMYSWPSGGAGLPPLPATAGIADVRLSTDGATSSLYVLGLDGVVYRSDATAQRATQPRTFSAWAAQEGQGIIGMRTATGNGNAVYTDGKKVYSTMNGSTSLPPLPSDVTLTGVAQAGPVVYALTTSGRILGYTQGSNGWLEQGLGNLSADYLSVSQTDGSAAHIDHAR